MKSAALWMSICGCVLLAACDFRPESPRGFRLPDGDPGAGRQVYVSHGCSACHDLPSAELAYSGDASPVTLGGELRRVKTYGDLVTSVINPSHKLVPGYPASEIMRDGESRMVSARLNEKLTVQQLVDLVAFLQPQYKLVVPTYNPYTHIYP